MAISELTGFLKYKDANGDIKLLNPIIDAENVAYNGGRLPDFMPVFLTQDAYDQLVADNLINDTTPYLIYEE